MSRPRATGDRLRRELQARRVSLLRRAAAVLHEWSDACLRLAKGRPIDGRGFSKKARASWTAILAALERHDDAGSLLSAGVVGDDLPRGQGRPAGSRILVLAAHQDDETIGAGGTFLLSADAGAAFHVIYYTDGATGLGDAPPADVSRWRHEEAMTVWRRIAGVTPIFWDYPNHAPDVAPDAGPRLAAVIAEFKPDTIFVPNFLEQPVEHRRLTDVLLAAHAHAPLSRHIEIWGYQITTRLPGNRVVDVTPVWKKKYAVNRLWATQNAFMDYAHLAMGRDIANSYYLKGGRHPRRAAAHAEVFLTFDARSYLEYAARVVQAPATAAAPDFLVIGMQKSGSYWLTALLDAHPAIRCFPSRPGHADGAGEAHLFDVLARLDSDYSAFARSMRTKLEGFLAPAVPDVPPSSDDERRLLIDRLRARFNEYCALQRTRAGKSMVGEKTTETVHHPEMVRQLYPGMRKVCILRDPRDRAVSFFFHQQRKGRVAAGAGDQDAFVRHYVERVEKDYRGLLRMDGPLHVLTYEQLWAAPREEVRRLLDFLGADAADAVVDAMIRAASFESLSGRRAGDADPSSHFRQGTAGGWIEHLLPRLAEQMTAALEPLTREVESRFAVDLSAYRQVPERLTR